MVSLLPAVILHAARLSSLLLLEPFPSQEVSRGGQNRLRGGLIGPAITFFYRMDETCH